MGGEAITRPVLVAESTIHEVTGALGDVGDPGRLGRARQLYAALWEQLDQARQAAASAGYDVAAYDAMRAARPHDLTAAEQTPLAQKDGAAFVAQVVVGIPQVTRIQLDLDGLVLARRCVEALRAAAPDLPWAEEQRSLATLADTNVKSGGAALTAIWLLVIAAGVVIVWVYYKSSP